jgi:type IV pilus assembly protein PilO
MDLKELQNFDLSDFERLGSAPAAVRALLAALVLSSVVGLGYYLHTRDQMDGLKNVESKELDLKKTFEKKHHQAANLETYKVQLAEMEKEFGAMLRQLPGKTEIPAVILDVSQTGLASGLKIMRFKPQAESTKGFYAEKPIQIRVRGNYHEMAKFSSGIASLPRIVTLHDIVLKPEQGSDKLIMDVTAKTYRYLADDEVEDNKEPGNA